MLAPIRGDGGGGRTRDHALDGKLSFISSALLLRDARCRLLSLAAVGRSPAIVVVVAAAAAAVVAAAVVVVAAAAAAIERLLSHQTGGCRGASPLARARVREKSAAACRRLLLSISPRRLNGARAALRFSLHFKVTFAAFLRDTRRFVRVERRWQARRARVRANAERRLSASSPSRR